MRTMVKYFKDFELMAIVIKEKSKHVLENTFLKGLK